MKLLLTYLIGFTLVTAALTYIVSKKDECAHPIPFAQQPLFNGPPKGMIAACPNGKCFWYPKECLK